MALVSPIALGRVQEVPFQRFPLAFFTLIAHTPQVKGSMWEPCQLPMSIPVGTRDVTAGLASGPRGLTASRTYFLSHICPQFNREAVMMLCVSGYQF